MSHYQRLIHDLDPTKSVNPAYVEAVMRLEYGTLGHVERETFIREIDLAKKMRDRSTVDDQRRTCANWGLAADFDEWQGRLGNG